MNAHTTTAVATLRPLRDIVVEYDQKLALIDALAERFDASVREIAAACSIGGAYGGSAFPSRYGTPTIDLRTARLALLKSAWRHVYDGLNISRVASAQDKDAFARALEDPAPFTLDNVAATFGDFVARPRHHILRGLAEIFADLDPAYRSHEKVKIGVAGLPKRVILSGFGEYAAYGRDRLTGILNAIRAYRGQPMVEYREVADLMAAAHPAKGGKAPIDDMELRRFANGNAHLHFGPQALLDVNRALAEFYGDVLPDTPYEVRPERRQSTAVSADLAFYPTPEPVIARMLEDLRLTGLRVLEPSCGDGRILQAIAAAGGRPFGYEVDVGRAAQARALGHPVICANFLEVDAVAEFDAVVMNPPFAGRHYDKHVAHATRFLVPGGQLVAVLPATARYDHCILNRAWMETHGVMPIGWGRDGGWADLPVGAFSESGTNVCTSILRLTKTR